MINLKKLKVEYSKLLKKSPLKKYLLIGIPSVLLLVILYLGRSLFVAAIVNGKIITRLAVVSELEKQGGTQTLDNLIVKALIFQEGNKKGITISQEEIDAELKRIEELVSQQGMTLDQALSLQNQSRNDLIDQIKIQKTVELILADKLAVSDQEVEEYFNNNKDIYEAGVKLEDKQAEIKSQLAQSKLSQEYQTWITDLKKNASINYFLEF